ncbi:hypothetical protein [Streptomyces sp. NPDC054765]
MLGGAVHRTLRAHGVYGPAAGRFDHLPAVLFGAGAGLAAGLLWSAAGVRLLVWRERRSRLLPRPPAARTAASAAAGTTTAGPEAMSTRTAPEPADRRHR